MRADERAVAEIAASVADGAPVDWGTIEDRVPGPDRRLVRHLRLVESISTLYRTLQSEPDQEVTLMPRLSSDGPMWGSLVLRDRIGAGTSCEVYKAWDSALHRDVALKLLKDEGPASRDAHRRVLEEARRLARVRHQHVVQVYGAEQNDGRVGLWMELVDGESLEHIVKTRGPYGAAEAALAGQQLCAALAAVHGAGLLHRDVKAQNVLRESRGRIVLMDFGTGEELRTNAGTNRLVGTPMYLAPELFRGHAATVQSDVYSLGVLLFYLVTGEFPVTAGSMEALARAHAESSRRRLRDVRPDLPDGFVAVVERALDPNPERRFRTAGEMELALRSWPETATIVTDSKAPVAARRWPFAAAAAVLVAATFSLIVWSGIGTRASVTKLAVLPFTHGPGAKAPIIADALTDQLIATLGQVESLQVLDRSSTDRFRATAGPPDAIASTLGVDAVLQPDLTIVGDGTADPRARVEVRLIQAGSGATTWVRTFERELGATPALLADVARSLTENVRASLRAETARRLERLPATSQASAEAYFQGRHHLKRLSVPETRLAMAAFERALELDPQHAAAHGGLAQSYVNLGFLGALTHAEARPLALAEIERALALDADSSEARVLNADLKFYYNWDWRGADAEYQRAIALNPSSAHAVSQYARYLAAAGRINEAMEQAKGAVALNPLSASAASTLALMHYYNRDFASAVVGIQEALRLEPNSPGAHYVLARVRAASGAIADAIVANEQAIALAGDNQAPIGWRANLIALHARAGRRQEARESLQQLSRELEQRNQPLRPEQLALVHLALSETEVAVDLFERAARERSPNIMFVSADPILEDLRQHERFRRVVSAIARGSTF